MKRLSPNIDDGSYFLNSLRFIAKNKEKYIVEENYPFSLHEKSLNSYIQEMEDAAVECFGDIFKGCKMPQIPFPEVTLPQKKYEGEMCSVGTKWDIEEQKCCKSYPLQQCVESDPSGNCVSWDVVYHKVCKE